MLNRKGSYMQAALPLPIKNEDYSFEKRRSSSINQSIPGNGPRKSIFVRRNSYLSRKSSESNNNQLIQRFQPTYKMDIEEHEKFKPWLIEPKLEEVLEDALRGKVYNPSMSGMLCKELSQNILREIRSMPLVLSPRYKLIANVIIGQSGGQGVQFSSRCLWDDGKDNTANSIFKSETLYAVATVYAIYYE